ncbi:MAG TPA: hypothetical protein VFJ58_03915, partial [Armatimonadota bacterium]|nr:hypothetical protein [Armatimonadota bacterium]
TGTNPDGSAGDCFHAVCIPHDQSKRSREAVAQMAAAALAYYQKYGTPPPSWYQVGIGPTIGPKR